jgi:hypothetical protein
MRSNRQSARLGTTNNVAVATTSTAVASAAFGSQTYQVRVAAPAACTYSVDKSPTATATDAAIPANKPVFVTVAPGEKISIFSATIQTVSIKEITQ